MVLGAYRDKLVDAGKALSSVKKYAGEKISRGHRVSCIAYGLFTLCILQVLRLAGLG